MVIRRYRKTHLVSHVLNEPDVYLTAEPIVWSQTHPSQKIQGTLEMIIQIGATTRYLNINLKITRYRRRLWLHLLHRPPSFLAPLVIGRSAVSATTAIAKQFVRAWRNWQPESKRHANPRGT